MNEAVLTIANVKALTDERTFARGEEYFRLGQVLWLAETLEGFCAVVQGQRAYHVTLRVMPEGLQPCCDCLAASANDWCKHAVAVALTAIHTPPRVSLTEISAYLYQLSPANLVELLLQAAGRDEDLRERLWLQMLTVRPAALEAMLPDDYRRAADLALSQARWAGKSDEVIFTLRRLAARLTETENSTMAVALLDYALKQLPALPVEDWRNLRAWITRGQRETAISP
jgi:hypothetical protein